MKKFLLKAFMLLCMLMVCMGAWATDVTFSLGTANGKDISSNSGTTKENVSVSFANGTGTALSWQTDHVRFYHNGSKVTISSATANITSIVINAKSGYTSADLKVGSTSITANDGKTQYSYSPSSPVSSVSITNEGSAQARLTSIIVTTSDGSGDSGDQGGGDDSGDTPTPSAKYVYEKVTSQSDITAGETYIIVCEDNNTAMGSQSSNSRRNPANVSISSNKIVTAVNVEGLPYEVTLKPYETYFEMILSNDKYLGNGSNSSNQLKEVAGYASGYGWTLTYSSGSVTMKTNHTTTQRYLCVNTQNQDSYSTYTSIGSYKTVTLYKKVGIAISISDAGYSTLYLDYAVNIPSGVQAFTGVLDGNKLTMTELPDGKIPAETAVVLKASKASYTFETTTCAPFSGSNHLKGCLIATATNTIGGGTVCTLANGEDGVGFYKYTGENLGANKAYLVVPENQARVTMSFDDEESAIETVEVEKQNNDMFDLMGRRTNNKTGLRIVNGKKVMLME